MQTIKWLSNKIGVQSDKVLHFLVCFVIAFVLSFVNPIFAAAATMIVGMYKEFTDSHEEKNYWSWGDILADLAGVAAAVVLFFLIFV